MNNERIYPAAPVITSGQRAKLRSLASTMSPVTQIGKGGVTENFLTGIDDALEARVLIMISVLETSEYTPREAAEGIADALNATVVGVIGRKIILYRRSLNGKRHIELYCGSAFTGAPFTPSTMATLPPPRPLWSRCGWISSTSSPRASPPTRI